MAPCADINLVVHPPSAWSNADLWDREYTQARAIPSSYRRSPSHSFLRLQGALAPFVGASVLDAGAGTGRHALHLARMGCTVHAVDASGAACEVLNSHIGADRSLARRIAVEHASLGVTDFPDSRYDIVIDSYVSCHILSSEDRLQYLEGLRRLLLPGGVLYTACMGEDDEYYAHRARPRDGIATDPLNGVTKLLQSRQTFRDDLQAFAYVTAVTTERFRDHVAGTSFRREVLAATIKG